MQTIEFREFEAPVQDEIFPWLAELNQLIFGFNETAAHLAQYFKSRAQVYICIAFVDGKPVAFKAGTDEGEGLFESWRGGVLSSVRRQGIASELMRLQHQWCANRGFKRIRTVTNSDNSSMLILNLRSGFEIMGIFTNRAKRLKVLLEKRLSRGEVEQS